MSNVLHEAIDVAWELLQDRHWTDNAARTQQAVEFFERIGWLTVDRRNNGGVSTTGNHVLKVYPPCPFETVTGGDFILNAVDGIRMFDKSTGDIYQRCNGLWVKLVPDPNALA